jgi:hypothetical protein
MGQEQEQEQEQEQPDQEQEQQEQQGQQNPGMAPPVVDLQAPSAASMLGGTGMEGTRPRCLNAPAEGPR